MNRNALGIAAALLLVAGLFIWWRGPGGENALGLAFGCIRVGLVLGALWLAYPQLVGLVRGVPAAVWNYFVGKGKAGAPRANQPAEEGERAEPVKIKRPRRRSSA
jgi:hypothetical protein